MKLYIATLILHAEYEISATTFADTSAEDLAFQVCEYLDKEGETPYDPVDIIIECENGNQHNEPLSIGADTDLCHEYLLTTKVTEI